MNLTNFNILKKNNFIRTVAHIVEWYNNSPTRSHQHTRVKNIQTMD
jgi:hypothetical protein